MRRVMLCVVLVTMMVGSCSSSEPLAFDLAQPMQPPPTPVTISGAAVDEGVVCASGTFVDYRMEDLDGNPLDIEGWSRMFDAAIESGSVAEAMSYNDYECDDGSGTLTVGQHVRFDFAGVDLETPGQFPANTGTWTLEGTGDYDSVTGSGDIIDDHDQGMIHMVGEVEA